ncbi:hypothetical protein GONAM_16_00090 [Gordonia namibiensis NBRC 108229]|uniref:DUF4190 domain-containing protein n=1 Tax=Gordonia namibiensis NBRC 108229 TaxID=1208314 RepID=K6XNU1_9ACTN|nr:DUF4190 domain-containing protein [Gordonia namibiensis]GAC00510.1 hypothetical protein GONAM_16_00090 [Gordonia namibiensis NBRC 108229]
MTSTARRGFTRASDLRQSAPATAAAPQPIRRNTNVCAIISLLCALFVLALPAVVFGAIGLSETRRRDHEDGSLLAAWGLGLGIVELALVVIVFSSTFFAGVFS